MYDTELYDAIEEIHQMVSSTWVFSERDFKKDDTIKKIKRGGYWAYYKICQKCGRKYYRKFDVDCYSH